jgi:hypothetical protein
MSSQVDPTETALPLALNVSELGLGGLTGLYPTVAVRNISVGLPAQYLDWDDGTFKSGGWGLKYAVMAEIERGNYQLLLDIAALGLAAGAKLSAEYHVDTRAGSGDDAEVFDILAAGSEDLALLRKALTNRMEESPGNPGQLTLFDDDGASILLRWPLRDVSGGAVTATVGTPARRGAHL